MMGTRRMATDVRNNVWSRPNGRSPLHFWIQYLSSEFNVYCLLDVCVDHSESRRTRICVGGVDGSLSVGLCGVLKFVASVVVLMWSIEVCRSGCVVGCRFCWHCQVEDSLCNGTDTTDGCKYQGCTIGHRCLCRDHPIVMMMMAVVVVVVMIAITVIFSRTKSSAATSSAAASPHHHQQLHHDDSISVVKLSIMYATLFQPHITFTSDLH